MIPLLAGTAGYMVAGTLSKTFVRHRYWFSLAGWLAALGGLVRGVLLYSDRGAHVAHLGEWGVLGIEFKLDLTTLLFAALVVSLNLFTLLYLRTERQSTYYMLYNFLFAASYSLAFSNDLFNIYVTIELLSLISILLIGYERKAYQIYAGIKYLVISSLAMSLYLIGLGLLYRVGGQLGISEMASVLSGSSSTAVNVGVGLMITGLAVKGGIFLFSMWLPDVYSYSGVVVSVLLAGVASKAGLIGIIRISTLVTLNDLLIGLGVLTGVSGAIFAVLSKKPKRLLAFSSMSQVGYILLGVGLGTNIGILIASLHIFFHGLFKGLLFLSLGHAGVGTRNIFGEDTTVPVASKVGLVVGSFSIMAVPPLNGYFSKTLLLDNAGPGWMSWAIIAIGFLTAIYVLKLDWGLVVKAKTGGVRPGYLPVLGLSAVVTLSSLVVWLVLGGETALHLLAPRHVTVALSLVPMGGLLLLFLWKKLQRTNSQGSLFNLDGAMLSLLTGFILVVSILIFGVWP